MNGMRRIRCREKAENNVMEEKDMKGRNVENNERKNKDEMREEW